jgi:hypothetical protein
MQRIRSLLLVGLVTCLANCATLPHPAGYDARLLTDDVGYYPPAKYYLTLEPGRDAPLATRIRDGEELTRYWRTAAQAKCGRGERVQITYGPSVGQLLPPYCLSPNVDELDWCLTVSGYFACD